MQQRRTRILDDARMIRMISMPVGVLALLAVALSCAPHAKKPGILKDALASSAPTAVQASAVSTGLRGAVQTLGSIPYDGFTLPVVSPDGRHFAIQSSSNASVKTRLAMPNASVPNARIATYRIESNGLSRISESEAGVLLGRGASFAGCLCEGPRPGGARALGVLPWGKSEVEWIVDDGRTNAFASLAPDATLAWSTREAIGGAWSLAIRIEGVEEDILIAPPEGGAWLFPVAVHRTCVCAVHLRDGVASFATFDPTNTASLHSPPTLTRISDRIDMYAASQMFAPQQGLDAITLTGDVLFFDPTVRAIVAWNPSSGKLVSFPGQPMALSCIDSMHVAALSGTSVRIRTMGDDQGTGTQLVESVAVPRRLPSADGQNGVLLVAPEGQTLRLAALRPLPFAPASKP